MIFEVIQGPFSQNFFLRNLRMEQIKLSGYLCQAFSAQCNVCIKGLSLPFLGYSPGLTYTHYTKLESTAGY